MAGTKRRGSKVQRGRSGRRLSHKGKLKITHTVIKGPLEKWWDGVKRRWGPRIVKAFAFVGAVTVIVLAIKEIL